MLLVERLFIRVTEVIGHRRHRLPVDNWVKLAFKKQQLNALDLSDDEDDSDA